MYTSAVTFGLCAGLSTMVQVSFGYSRETAGLLVAMVALQQVWGVDFDTAVQRGDAAIKAFLGAHRGRAVVFDAAQIVELMRRVTPPPR